VQGIGIICTKQKMRRRGGERRGVWEEPERRGIWEEQEMIGMIVLSWGIYSGF